MKSLKKILFTVIVACSFSGIAQIKEHCGEIHYSQVTNFSRTFEKNYILFFNKSNSIYKETKINTKKLQLSQTDSDKGQQLTNDMARNNLTPEYFYNDIKSFYFMEIWYDQELVVKENKLNWQWTLHKETKKLGKFTCQKATANFRGRNYIAWFTTEIPTFFGPRKFNGLTGLILEVYDEDKVFHTLASKIKITNTSECNIPIDKGNFNKALTIKEYNIKKTELIKADFAKLASRMPKGYRNLKLDENCNDCKEEIEKFND
ncbi:GLPGLI family protein [Lutibacter sp.]|uniref:GLPGLI family protein n=1 Tax=Lutibacter sp. TaxID=1925666 RepID=UPI002733E2E2|nr:GLPGLI family protein [Lutibacter sp.]MDP3314283.1 GLPGLI family protein [Lutibacter sp.]